MRAFAEVMKNMARMKACVRPAMCKPYGKQSEALQKSNDSQFYQLFFIFFFSLHINLLRCEILCTNILSQSILQRFSRCLFSIAALVDTIQLVQSLRSFLPPPHIPVSSWKNEDKHRLDHTGTPYLSTL